jgi:hypothetical protein
VSRTRLFFVIWIYSASGQSPDLTGGHRSCARAYVPSFAEVGRSGSEVANGVTGELGVGTVLAEPLLTNLLSRLSSKKLFQLGGSSVPLSLAAEKRPLTTGLPFCTKGRLVQDGLFVTATPFLAFIV